MNPEKSLIAKKDLPLYGRRILCCAPRNYAQKLIRLLALHGALPVWMPTIAIEPMDDYTELDEALKNLERFQWVSFTSRNGIEAFFDRLDALGLDLNVLEKTRVSALGNDAKLLEEYGVSVDLLPARASTKGVVEELKRRGQKSGRILLPVPEVYGMAEPPVIPDYVRWLEELGMDVQRVPAYATRRVTGGLEPELEMILAGKVDLIAFTSVGEVDSLLFMLDEKRDALAKHTIACFGPVTADGARQRGVHADIVSEQYSSFEFFIEAMERYFAG